MPDIRYLLDENIAPAIRNLLLLHAPSLTVIRIGDQGAPAYGTSDEEILSWIEEHGYLLVSRDRRTMPAQLQAHLARGGHVPGILLVRRHAFARQLIEDLILIWQASELTEYFDHIRYLPL
jgi:hypothetical protein